MKDFKIYSNFLILVLITFFSRFSQVNFKVYIAHFILNFFFYLFFYLFAHLNLLLHISRSYSILIFQNSIFLFLITIFKDLFNQKQWNNIFSKINHMEFMGLFLNKMDPFIYDSLVLYQESYLDNFYQPYYFHIVDQHVVNFLQIMAQCHMVLEVNFNKMDRLKSFFWF